MHAYDGLAFWDYASAAPYCKVDVNPKHPADANGLLAKDAAFFSTHKMVGGVQGPGVLVAKKSLFNSGPEGGGGGGSVFFVTQEDHRYLRDVETREESGTPAIIETVTL